MDFELTPEQRDLKEVVAKVGGQRADLDEMAAQPVDYLERSWVEVTEHIGLHALLIPEELDGLSGSVLDACVAAEQLAADLYAPAFLIAGVVAPVLLGSCGDNSFAPLLKEVAAGARRVVAPAAPHAAESLILEQISDGHVGATGTIKSVLALPGADVVVVPASVGSDPGVLVVEIDRLGVTRSEASAIDLGRPVFDLHLDRAECAWRRADPTRYRLAWDTISAVVAAELCGTARAALEQSVAHAEQRTQFGVAIASFQAIKHLAADMVAAVEGAQACTRAAASFLDNGSDEASECAASALMFARDAAYRCTSSNLQVHGAIAYTWEHSAHHHYRRALTGKVALVSPEDVITALVGVCEPAQ